MECIQQNKDVIYGSLYKFFSSKSELRKQCNKRTKESKIKDINRNVKSKIKSIVLTSN